MMRFQQRDWDILKFLWVWKLAPTAVLAKRFFPNVTCKLYPYKRLRKLQQAGYLKQVAILNGGNSSGIQKVFLWTISKNGFKEARSLIGALKEEGCGSEHPHHDWLTSAIHLGEYLGNLPENVRLFSENQLRRYDVGRYPSWVPTESGHRPDGYWYVNNGAEKSVYALEVETWVKAASRYTECASFYRRVKNIGGVFWYVDSIGEARSIQKALKVYDEARVGIHQFILISDFISLGWNAPIVAGQDRSKTLRDFITTPVGNLSATSMQLVPHRIWFDHRIARTVSTSCAYTEKHQKADCIGIYTPKPSLPPSTDQKSPLDTTSPSLAPSPATMNNENGVQA